MRMMSGTTRKISISVTHDQIENSDAEPPTLDELRIVQLWVGASYVHRYSCIEPSARQPSTMPRDTLTARLAVQ